MSTVRLVATRMIAAPTVALVALVGWASSAPASAARQQLSATYKLRVDSPLEDFTDFGVAAWQSGSLSVQVRRMADGRIDGRVHARLVLRRAVVAEISVSPCNAVLNPASALDPVDYPPVPTVWFSGVSPSRIKQLHKGANDWSYEAQVSSDDPFTTAPADWADCAQADVTDMHEVDHHALALTPQIVYRVGDRAFATSPMILSQSTGK